MSRPISIFGLGYVGTVTAACLAHKGNRVIGVDLNPAKVEAIEAGRSPIVEPRVPDLVAECHQACRLHATSDGESAVLDSDISFLCVGTPSLRNGKLNLGHIGPVCREIGSALRKKNSFHLIVLRSTVLPGTAESIVIPELEKSSGKHMGDQFGVCVNPEFMREGTAVGDFLEPAITIIGTEVGTLAKRLNVDADAVMEIFAADNKLNISSAYLKPGFAFGGSCLPKDLRALNYRAKEFDLELPLLNSILPSNHEHLERALEMVLEIGKRRIAVLGLSFKAATDDLRESPHVQLVKRLLGEGYQVQIWDDNVSLGRLIGSNRQYIEEVIPHIGSLLSNDLAKVIAESEVVVLGTRGIQGHELSSYLRPEHIVIDLVNLEKTRRPKGSGRYEGICW